MDTLSCIVPLALLAAVIVSFAWGQVSAAEEALRLKDDPTNGAPKQAAGQPARQRPREER